MARKTMTTTAQPLENGLFLLGTASAQVESLRATLAQAEAQLGADKRFRHDLANITTQVTALAEAIEDAAANAEMVSNETAA
ncbi:MAG: hypothetical protein WC326_13010 [Candidatus Delongbacteria bacterium]